jgi:hypothetical protein
VAVDFVLPVDFLVLCFLCYELRIKFRVSPFLLLFVRGVREDDEFFPFFAGDFLLRMLGVVVSLVLEDPVN